MRGAFAVLLRLISITQSLKKTESGDVINRLQRAFACFDKANVPKSRRVSSNTVARNELRRMRTCFSEVYLRVTIRQDNVLGPRIVLPSTELVCT